MAVYVDDAFAHGDWGRWSGGGHMQADTADELHAMAARVGLRREWFQSKPARPWHDHYDLTRERRELAIAFGAIPVGRRETVRRIAADRLKRTTPEPGRPAAPRRAPPRSSRPRTSDSRT